jgi:tetratricopeptide (TPR) repeat protein
MFNIKTSASYVVVALAALIVFFNTFQNDFAFDDESVIQNNESITKLSNIPSFFTGDNGFHKVIGKYYRPIVSISYTLDYALYGLSPKGFHVTNVIIHIIASLLLFRIFTLLFAKSKYCNIISLLVTLVFVVHPIHTESVSWISGRTDSIATLFFFAAFLYYVKFTDSENKTNKFLILSLVYYFIGLLSKEMIVTMPVIIVMYDFIYRRKPLSYVKENFKTYALFAAVTIFYFVIRYLALKDIPDRMSYMYFIGKDASVVFFTMIKTVPLYFKLLLFPINLLYHYNGVLPDSNSLDPNVIFSLIFVLGMIVSSVLLYKKQNKISFVLLFFLVTLLPVMNIIPTMNFMAERFLYMTSFCLSLLLGVLFVKYINDKNKFIIVFVSLLIILPYSFLTIKRNAEWKDNDTLYSTADGVDGYVLLVNAGNIYANKKNYDEAAKRYRRAIQIRDNTVLGHHNLGLIFLIRGQLDSAEAQFKKGLQIDSLAPDGYLQLAQVYNMRGEKQEAIKYLEKLQTISPNYRDSQDMLKYLKMEPTQVSTDTTKTTDNPQVNQLKVQLLEKSSYEHYSTQKYKEAIKDLEQLVELNPGLKSGYQNNIGMCYVELKDYKKALDWFLEGMKSDKTNVNAMSGAADTYLQLGNKQKALEIYKSILELTPNNLYAKGKIDSLQKVK